VCSSSGYQYFDWSADSSRAIDVIAFKNHHFPSNIAAAAALNNTTYDCCEI
jgi:hypothetical protein